MSQERYAWLDRAGIEQGYALIPAGTVFEPDPMVRAKVESGEWTITRETLPEPEVVFPEEGFAEPDWRDLALRATSALADVLPMLGAGRLPDDLAEATRTRVQGILDEATMAQMVGHTYTPEPPPQEGEPPEDEPFPPTQPL